MTPEELARWRDGEPCPRCDDSGWQEFASGGIWTGENIRVRQEICDCPCGDDVRRELETQHEARP